jgi:hypothetical protein
MNLFKQSFRISCDSKHSYERGNFNYPPFLYFVKTFLRKIVNSSETDSIEF